MGLSQSPLLVYIHGFNSSPGSYKAIKLGEWLAAQHPGVQYEVPTLSPYPNCARDQLTELLDSRSDHSDTYLVGSSLGGYYASYLAEFYQCKAVLINPSVSPFDSLKQYLGENENFHTGEKYRFDESHADDLRGMQINKFSHPEKIWVLLQTGDETLDFREASSHYFTSPCAIEYGGDHGFQGFENWMPRILDFFERSE